jgi:hypothetical protein
MDLSACETLNTCSTVIADDASVYPTERVPKKDIQSRHIRRENTDRERKQQKEEGREKTTANKHTLVVPLHDLG